MRRPTLVTFDVYSALVDFEAGLMRAVKHAAPAVSEPAAFVRAWRARQLEYAQISNSLQRERIPFRVITRRALEYTLARAGASLDTTSVNALCAAWDMLPPWPEAAAALSALRARGYKLALLSNGDEEMLRALVRSIEIAFDHVLASDHAGCYKPHPAVYALPVQRLGLDATQVLHVAGASTDVLGAKLAGLSCVWSNRTGDRALDPRGIPDRQVRDLSGLLDILPE